MEEIRVARDGQETLDQLYYRAVRLSCAAENPKMILLDIKLPKVDGLEVLQQIKADPDLKAPLLVTLTSAREMRDLLRSYNRVTNACVVKPMSFRFFAATVKEVGLFREVINQPPSTAERAL
jgi:CheY-like chemotaxis protein